ncbi:MAG: hypothetical protein SCH70_06700 [Candidatus Methanoperedens sp.]|nr:hypothetical protein [Candidatus Methanoperedens sp.]
MHPPTTTRGGVYPPALQNEPPPATQPDIQLVYKLYDLTPEEIEIVEGFNQGK